MTSFANFLIGHYARPRVHISEHKGPVTRVRSYLHQPTLRRDALTPKAGNTLPYTNAGPFNEEVSCYTNNYNSDGYDGQRRYNLRR